MFSSWRPLCRTPTPHSDWFLPSMIGARETRWLAGPSSLDGWWLRPPCGTLNEALWLAAVVSSNLAPESFEFYRLLFRSIRCDKEKNRWSRNVGLHFLPNQLSSRNNWSIIKFAFVLDPFLIGPPNESNKKWGLDQDMAKLDINSIRKEIMEKKF